LNVEKIINIVLQPHTGNGGWEKQWWSINMLLMGLKKKGQPTDNLEKPEVIQSPYRTNL
jgi:hypothetical protein